MNDSKPVSLDELKSRLAHTGVPLDGLRTLRDIAVEGDEQLAGLPIQELEHEYPIYTLAVPVDKTMLVWENLKAVSHSTGHWPVILGDRNSVGHHWESREDAKFPNEYLELSQAHNAKAWLDAQWKDYLALASTSDEVAEFHGRWDEKCKPATEFDVSRLYYRQSPPEIYIGLLPTTTIWELPAYLAFGCYNDCPCPDVHASVQRYWHSLYKTEIVAMLFDTLVCRVEEPVTTRETATQLAYEQVGYCSDILIVGALPHASSLMNSTYWTFWWD